VSAAVLSSLTAQSFTPSVPCLLRPLPHRLQPQDGCDNVLSSFSFQTASSYNYNVVRAAGQSLDGGHGVCS
jgi:hypothetical protein